MDKMETSKKKKILIVAAALLGAIALLTAFAPVFSVKGSSQTTSFNAIDLTFGYQTKDAGATVYRFSFCNLLFFVFLLAGIAFCVVSLFGKLGKISGVVSALCYTAAAVWIVLMPTVFSIRGEDFGKVIGAMWVGSFGAGFYLPCIFSLVATALSIAGNFVIKE